MNTNKPEFIFIVSKDEVYAGESNSDILGVYENYSDACIRLKEERNRCCPDWEDEKIEEDKENSFDAYRDGEYILYHCTICVTKIKIQYHNEK